MYLKNSFTDNGLSGGETHAGTQFDPLPSGQGGGSGVDLAAITKNGIIFKQMHFENGVFGEKYILVLGSDLNFYKFQQYGTGLGVGTPSDSMAKEWFSHIVTKAKDEMASATAASKAATEAKNAKPGSADQKAKAKEAAKKRSIALTAAQATEDAVNTKPGDPILEKSGVGVGLVVTVLAVAAGIGGFFWIKKRKKSTAAA